MSSDYTPTTEEVQDYYAHGQFADPSMSEHDHARAFDRWLAVYTAEKQAEALELAAAAGAGYVVTVANRRYREGAEHADIYWKLALERAAQRLREQATNQQDRSQ